jgi:hypothetical protein
MTRHHSAKPSQRALGPLVHLDKENSIIIKRLEMLHETKSRKLRRKTEENFLTKKFFTGQKDLAFVDYANDVNYDFKLYMDFSSADSQR